MFNTGMFGISRHTCHIPFALRLCSFPSNLQHVRHKRGDDINNGQVKLLMEVFGLSYRLTWGIMSKNKSLRTLDQDHIKRATILLMNLGITKDEIAQNPKVLTVLPVTIENHSMLLQEGGFSTVTVQNIISYITIVRKPIRLLKIHGYIPPDVNVPESLLSHLKQQPPPFEPQSPANVSEDQSFMDVQLAVLVHYLMWKLDASPAEVAELMKTYSRLKHRSFRITECALNILQENLGFSKEKIRRNGYLIHSNPDNILDSLKQIKSVGGISIKELFQKHPKVIMSSTDSLIKITEHLKHYGIRNEAIRKCPELFTLGSETVQKRLEALQVVPEFCALVKNSRVLRLVYHQHKASSRLSYLQEMKVKCASLHILSATQAQFEKYVQEGSDRTRGNDIIHFLSAELNVAQTKIRKMLHRHPFWCHVPLASVRDTLNFLFDKGYKKNQILFNIHILLYSRNQLEKQLNVVSTRAEVDIGCWKSGTVPPGTTTYITPEQTLALCLYFIERDFHFTGHGIWADSIAVPSAT